MDRWTYQFQCQAPDKLYGDYRGRGTVARAVCRGLGVPIAEADR
jgi:hypothetical protein